MGPTFSENDANMYIQSEYSNANPVNLDNLNWFPYLPVPASNPFNLEPVCPKDIKAILQNKKSTPVPGPDGIM